MKLQKLGRYEISEIVYGSWRVVESDLSTDELVVFLRKLIELGINTIDTADIYGGKYHAAELKIGEAFKLDPSLKENFRIITKTGIVAVERSKLPYYENQFDYIVESVKDSISSLNVDKIDILLLHRPDLFADFNEIYRSFKYLKDNHLVVEFGVSNYTPLEFDALSMYLSKRGINLVTNQIEINNFTEEHYENDNVFYLKGHEISPMIWSPMAGGLAFADNEIANGLEVIADEYNTSVEDLIIAYLHNQGLNPCTILGSHKIQRYEDALDGVGMKISSVDKYRMLKLLTKRDVR